MRHPPLKGATSRFPVTGLLLADEVSAASFATACPNLSGIFVWLVLGILLVILVAFSGLFGLVCAFPKQTRDALCNPYTVAASYLAVNLTLLAPVCWPA